MAEIETPMINDAHRLLSRLALQGVRRAFAFMDLDPTSPTFGCMDRSFWYYRTLTNFSGAPWQQPMVGFAALDATPGPTEFQTDPASLNQAATAAAVAWSRLQHRSGAFDEWYRNEHSYCATAITTAGAVLTLDLLGDRIADESRSQVMTTIERAVEWLSKRYNKSVMNQNLAAAVALAGYGELANASLWRERAGVLLERIAGDQSSEGWFPEYGGFDFGYSMLAMDFLALGDHFGQSASVGPMAERLIAFLLDVIDADRPIPGRLGSRGTCHAFLAGAISFADRLPSAARLARRVLSVHAARLAPTPESVDDRYFAYFYFPGMALAYRAACCSKELGRLADADAPNGSLRNVSRTHSGITVCRLENAAAITSQRFGGAFALLCDLQPPLYHLGYTVVSRHGRFSSATWQDVRASSPCEGSAVMTASFVKVSGEQPLRYLTLPFQLIVHLLFISRLAEAFQSLLKNRMVAPRSTLGLLLERACEITNKQVVLRDRLIPNSPLLISDIDVTSSITMHSPSGRMDVGEVCALDPKMRAQVVERLSAGLPAVLVWRFAVENGCLRSVAELADGGNHESPLRDWWTQSERLPARGSGINATPIWQAIRFLLVGSANTIAGLCFIYGLIFFGVGPVIANFVGYAVAVPLGYVSHALVSFDYRGRHARSFPRYLIALVIAYVINLTILLGVMKILFLSKYLAQIPAFMSYAVVFLLLNRHFVFPAPNTKTPAHANHQEAPV